METKFNFKSAICTSRFQSERLLALGLKPETADMCHFWHWESDDYSRVCASWEFAHRSNKDIPAWSLHRLIEMMPTTINNMLWFNATHYTALYDSIDYIKSFEVKDNLYDNIIDCIEWLIKEGYFPKEYLI